eukprot:4764797-Prymnesium_polylepis.1
MRTPPTRSALYADCSTRSTSRTPCSIEIITSVSARCSRRSSSAASASVRTGRPWSEPSL